MKKLLSTLILLSVIVQSYGQTATENYIQSRSYLEPVTATSTTAKQINTVQYFDGLGRPKQVVNVKASPLGRDVVNHLEYDEFGRQVKFYLPVPQSLTQDGELYSNPLSNATQSDIYGSEKIYSEKRLESSPLDKMLQQINVGNDWSSKPVKFDYDTNTDGEVRKYFTTTTWVENRTSSILKVAVTNSSNGFFIAQQLYKNITTDEDGNIRIEFKNLEGQTLLSRNVLSQTENADTYYVYNEQNQIAFVIPPKASDMIKSLSPGTVVPDAVLNELCYQYRYDKRLRLVERKLPNKGLESFVYDRQDRLVATQDANLREKGQWQYSKYDQFGRIAIVGINTGGSRIAEQEIADGLAFNNVNRLSTALFERQGMPVYYGNPDNTYPNSSKWVTLLSLNYYDSYPPYSFNPTFPTSVLGQLSSTDSPTADVSTNNLPVMSFIKNLEDDNWTKNYNYYDKKGRGIGTYSINHLGGYTKTESKLDFTGVAQTMVTKHKRLDADTERVITENFTYDHQNRLLVHKHKVDSNPEEILVQNTYNELSQISNKKLGGITASATLQSIDYKYNIRGWMSQINDPANLNGKLFGYTLRYTDPVYSTIAPGRYNGSIAEIDWNVSTLNNLKRYNYTYDKLNRLTDAEYAEPETTNPHNKNYDERLTYDVNGNIASLKRNAVPVSGTTATTVDNLTYQYTGNRLDKVTESALNDTGYEGGNNTIDYDLNGNMINMKDKGIQSIVYNYLNLPDSFSIILPDPFMLGQPSSATLTYLYRADGTKLRKNYYKQGRRGASGSTHITDYLDGFQYSYLEGGGICLTCKTDNAFEEQAYTNVAKTFPDIDLTPQWKLDFVPTAEGFYSFTENRYIYQYRDHLGNARVSFAKNSEGLLEVTDKNDYYPFGLNHIQGIFEGANLGSYYSYKYNGKELQETGMYDYGARFYMPDLGRWGVVDNKAEKYFSLSPYHYAGNNPIMYFDIDGNEFTEDAWIWVNRLIADINSRQAKNNVKITDFESKIAAGGKAGQIKRWKSNIADLKANNADLESVRGETATMAASNQIYDVIENDDLSDSSFKTGAFGFNYNNGKAYMVLPKNSGLAMFAHELKHGYQFETGESGSVTRDQDEKGVAFLHDKTDEVVGYQRGKLFGQNDSYSTGSLPDAYKNLPTGPINTTNHPEISRAMKLPPAQRKVALQNIANQGKAFRVEGQTYYKK
ncbi:DUF6443 domain-containing protein [Chryseobacterium phocaeense]|uniref:DUF6443 domain-containing protein n=1 Tax=Chryseobacterium phocaeense TaxID=1816690 RepID=UPI0013EEFDBA|nr:DUF6443 domain-containing protein [Chryseobacterium phocaeense]